MKKTIYRSLATVGSIAVILITVNCFSKEDTKKQTPKEVIAYKPDQDHKCVCTAKDLSNAFVEVTKDAKPAVVNVKVETMQENEGMMGQAPSPFEFFGDDFFQQFFGPQFRHQQQRPSQQQPQVSQGSGFIISPDGYVMTNFHVVKGASKVVVTLDDGYEKEVPAEVIGGDPYTDVAILKIAGSNLPYLNFGNSEKVHEGELVIAIGNPFQLRATVTVGVISAKGRQNLQINELGVEDFIQTDAAINPGNSGGPLLDLNGNVIGMNTAIVSRSGGYMGIGFAIPSSILLNIRDQLIANGEVSRGFLGVSLQPIDKELADAFSLNKPEGALVAEVVKNSPADKAGLKQGDIIIEANGNPVKSPTSLRNEILLMQPGTVVNLIVLREGRPKKVAVTLGSHEGSAAQVMPEAIQKLGLELEDLSPEKAKKYGYTQEEEGVFVRSVKKGSLAERAGIPPGSIIIAINHKKVNSVDEAKKALKEVDEKKRLLILLKYKGQMRFISLKVD